MRIWLIILMTVNAWAKSPDLARAEKLLSQGNFVEAGLLLYDISSRPSLKNDHADARYFLGQALEKQGYLQVAAFQYLYLVKNSPKRAAQKGLTRLAIIGDKLNDYSLLNYAIKSLDLAEIPKGSSDAINFRLGEAYLEAKEFEKAGQNFRKVPPSSVYYYKAKYLEGIAYSELNMFAPALRAFSLIVDNLEEGGNVAGNDRVAALLGMARVYYQAKRWDLSIDIYRQIPKDSEFWQDSLFELAWAQMRNGDFRSVLSSLHTLHSPYYEDLYNPESILLRSMAYFSLCKYDEMTKTLGLLDRVYEPIMSKMNKLGELITDPTVAFDQIEKFQARYSDLKKNKKDRAKLQIPFTVARSIVNDGRFKQAAAYLAALRDEKERLKDMDFKWRRSALGNYSERILSSRITTAKKVAGQLILARLDEIRQTLQENLAQADFGRYELLNVQKELVLDKMKGKVRTRTDDARDRSFFVQNGYEYWQFRGEYWLDELGSYYYVGNSECN